MQLTAATEALHIVENVCVCVCVRLTVHVRTLVGGVLCQGQLSA